MAGSTTPATTSDVKSGKVVVYIGSADVVRILKSDWARVGVEDQEVVVWSAKNKFTVPVADLTDKAVAYLDADDERFVVKDAS